MITPWKARSCLLSLSPRATIGRPPFWSAAAIHDPLCFGLSPVLGWQPLSSDRHGPDAALDRGCLITIVPISSTGTAGREKRCRRGACGVQSSGSRQLSMASLSTRIRPNRAALPAHSKRKLLGTPPSLAPLPNLSGCSLCLCGSDFPVADSPRGYAVTLFQRKSNRSTYS